VLHGIFKWLGLHVSMTICEIAVRLIRKLYSRELNISPVVKNRKVTCSHSFVLDNALPHNCILFLDTVTDLYYITGGGAPISLQSNKCRQKHGGFSRLLTPE
jgi:hypothetical protein